jgi:hypothetical protein
MIEWATTYPPTIKTKNVLYLSTRREVILFLVPSGLRYIYCVLFWFITTASCKVCNQIYGSYQKINVGFNTDVTTLITTRHETHAVKQHRFLTHYLFSRIYIFVYLEGTCTLPSENRIYIYIREIKINKKNNMLINYW